MRTIPIKYIGHRAVKRDTLTRSGLSWTPEQVIDVDEETAAVLLRHPDVWAAAGEPKGATEGKQSDEFAGLPIMEEEPEHEQMPHISRMPKEGLLKLAKMRYGETIDPSTKLADIRTRIMALENSGHAV